MRTAIKEIAIAITAVILMAGGLGIALTLETANGLALIAIIMFGVGGALLAFLIKKAR